MKRALDLFDQLRDIVQGKPWPEAPQIAGRYLEDLPRGDASIRQPTSQRLVDDVSERPAGAARFRLELGSHIVIQGERRSHALMLLTRHHDVNARQGWRCPARSRCVSCAGNTGVTRIMTAIQEANAQTVLGNFPLPDLRLRH